MALVDKEEFHDTETGMSGYILEKSSQVSAEEEASDSQDVSQRQNLQQREPKGNFLEETRDVGMLKSHYQTDIYTLRSAGHSCEDEGL